MSREGTGGRKGRHEGRGVPREGRRGESEGRKGVEKKSLKKTRWANTVISKQDKPSADKGGPGATR